MDAQTVFKRHFGYTPAHVVRAPGALELLGSQAEHNEGLAVAVAVNRYIEIASAPRADGKIELVSSAYPGREFFWMSELKKNPAAPWADYVKGVLDQLRKRGVNFSGFNAAVHGDIPMRAGMGSFAALSVGTALTVRSLYPFSLTETGATLPPRRNPNGRLPPLPAPEKLHFARLCHAAEASFVGGQSGLLDAISALFGKAWHVTSIDFRFLTIEHAPMIGEVLVVCHPCSSRREEALIQKPEDGGEKSKVRGQGSEIDQSFLTSAATMKGMQPNCESAARKLRAKSLRSVELSYLKANRSSLSPREYECAYHVVGEIARVAAAERALREDDHRQFGQYMSQSHESSRDFTTNSAPELDLLVELARKHPGCLGARLIGTGLGGGTVNLVAYHQAESFIANIAAEYAQHSGCKLQPIVCQMVEGAS